MGYFIFLKNHNNIDGSLYKIAENPDDLKILNLSQSEYVIIENSQENFNSVKLGIKHPSKYVDNEVVFETLENKINREQLKNYVEEYKTSIKNFTENNPTHPSFNKWNNYYNQLDTLNLDSITYPLNKSLEQYFNDLGQPSLNILQLP